MHEDQITQAIATARTIGRIRVLGRQPPETALPELARFLSPATPDQALSEVIMAVRSFGGQATELLPEIEKLANNHVDTGVRDLARSAVKRIRAAAEATGDSPCPGR